MIHIIEGDLFTTKADVICHQVNCQGVMGSGVAKQVKKRYPEVYNEYKELCDNYKQCEDEWLLPGNVQTVIADDGKVIANLFCQLDYGYDGRRYTNYEAVYEAFEGLNIMCLPEDSLAFPYHFACDRGGANWDIILKMMEVVFKDREVFIYKLN